MAIRLRDRRLARLGLLIAAALHLLGGGLLASVHHLQPAGGTVAVDVRHDGDPPRLPAEHHPDHCAFCQIAGATALPAAGDSPTHLTSSRLPVAEPHPAATPASGEYRPPARAPPAAA
jgi:hypothetical protein